jgi:hypothetical protein
MSPEQVRGEALDGRSDIYALGVILFEMLAGRGPFQSTTPLSIAFKHLTDPIPSIRLFRPELPEDVERVLNTAMAKERTLRYSTASELALDLRTIADSFLESDKPVLHRVQIRGGNDAATELDVEEHSQPAPEISRSSSTDSPAKIQTAPTPSQGSMGGSARPSPRFSLQPLQLAAIAGAGLVLFVLCGSLGIFGTWAGFQGLFAPTQANNVQEIVLFSDDFSNSSSGWPTGQNASGSYGYQSAGYHILVSGRDQVQWVSTDQVYDNVSIYVDAIPVTEGSNGYYGLLCRIQDHQNFYYFVIQNNGNYTIGKYKNAEFSSFFAEGWRQSDVIQVGNRLQADCTANTLRLFVNSVMIGEAADTEFASGSIGMVAATLGDLDFEVRFNNFLITK